MSTVDFLAAAKALWTEGNDHGWFPSGHRTFEDFARHDPIGFGEFLDIVNRVFKAAGV
jgi:hypothetical protein